ncbi:EpsG family protein [Sphingobium boeckii]|nr:EpsG family protein [Sphingobium boeckii]
MEKLNARRSFFDRNLIDVNKIYLLTAATVLFVCLNLIKSQRDFSDTDTYLFYIDSIYFFRTSDWWRFESLSKALMIVFRDLTADSEKAVYFLRYLLIYAFPFSIYYVYRKSSWRALAIAMALYGPLLGLITIRATPAYILAAIAAISAIEGRWRSIPILLAGFLFHVSTALAVPAILVTLAFKKFGLVNIKSRYIFATFFILTSLYAVLGSLGIQSAVDFIGSFSYLSKYTVYIPEANSANVAEESGSVVIHYVFMGATVGLGLFLIYMANENQGVDKIFIAISLFLYVILFLLSSPVVSLRYSPFFVIPALARIDFSFKGGWSYFTGFLIFILSLIVFSINVNLAIL